MTLRHWAAVLALLVPAPALAHPHVFISAGIEVLFGSDGRAEAVRISWTYDELFSLMILEDRGLDPDYDGVLTEAETAALSGFDMAWDPDFPGDTYALLGELPQPLGRPEDSSASLADGMITSVHTRRFAAPIALDGQALVIQAYDPGFYTAYSIDTEPRVTGRAECSAVTYEPDQAAAEAMLAQMLEEYSGEDIEAGLFPAVGAAFADEVRVTCAAPS
jgi:ABC-type uncharacterized transport system substrate-binding protein